MEQAQHMKRESQKILKHRTMQEPALHRMNSILLRNKKDVSVEIQSVKILNVKREKSEQVMEQRRTIQEKFIGQVVVRHIQR